MEIILVIILCFLVNELFNLIEKNIQPPRTKEKAARKKRSPLREIKDYRIKNLTGEEFEELLASCFTKLGYFVEFTPYSHDYGADLILYKNNIKTIIQVKKSKNKVGVTAVREVTAAIAHYQAERAMVITNNIFTREAYILADANKVELWDGDKLISFMIEVKKSPIVLPYDEVHG